MSTCNVEELYHHGIKGMKWGVRRFQKKSGSLTPAGKKRYSDNDRKTQVSGKGEKVFNALKKGANAALDKASDDNFFNSDSIFSEKSMKTQSRIDRTRDAINSLDYKTLTSKDGSKRLVDAVKNFFAILSTMPMIEVSSTTTGTRGRKRKRDTISFVTSSINCKEV